VETSSDVPPAPVRAPLLWLLLPLIAGYTAGAAGLAPPPLAAAAGGIIFAVAGLVLAGRGGRGCIAAQRASLLLGAFLLALAWHQYRAAPPLLWTSRPPTEATLQLRITRVLEARDEYGRATGFAAIAQPPHTQPGLAGRGVYFALEPREGLPPPVRSAVYQARGLLHYVPAQDPAEIPPYLDIEDPADYAAGRRAFFAYLEESGHPFTLRRGELIERTRAPAAWHALMARTNARLKATLHSRLFSGNAPPPPPGAPNPAPGPAGLYAAMLLGDKSLLAEAQKTAFQATGTMHLFAISGLHVGIIAGVLFWLLRRIPCLPRWAEALAGLLVLLLFVEVTGRAPSALRAWAMVAFIWGARALVRRPVPFPALVASAFAVLLVAPAQLGRAGFQLSYAVVAGILLYGLPLFRWADTRWALYRNLPESSWSFWQRRKRSLQRWVTGAFAVSLAATILAAPLTLLHFSIFAPGALALNLLLIPAAGAAVALGFVSGLAGLAGLTPLAALLNELALPVLAAMFALVDLFAGIPGIYLPAGFATRSAGYAAALGLLGLLLFMAARDPHGTRPRLLLLPPAGLAAVLLLTAIA